MSIDANALHGQLRLHNFIAPVCCVAPGTPLYRGSGHAGGHWEPPSLELRRTLPKQRADAPAGHEHRYAMLYLGEDETTIEFELGRLVAAKEAGSRQVRRNFQPGREATLAQHLTRCAAAFVDCDNPLLAATFGYTLRGGADELTRWQQVSLAVFEALAAHEGALAVPVVGLCWQSKMEGCNGRVFALYAQFRDTTLVRGEPRPFR